MFSFFLSLVTCVAAAAPSFLIYQDPFLQYIASDPATFVPRINTPVHICLMDPQTVTDDCILYTWQAVASNTNCVVMPINTNATIIWNRRPRHSAYPVPTAIAALLVPAYQRTWPLLSFDNLLRIYCPMQLTATHPPRERVVLDISIPDVDTPSAPIATHSEVLAIIPAFIIPMCIVAVVLFSGTKYIRNPNHST